MLSRLLIENYALIDKSTIDFKKGFTVVTGETGAGKSIMLGALSLLLGERADAKTVADKQKKTVVEAQFDLPSPELEGLFQELDIDFDPAQLVLRRELSATGRSRAFVNDTPVNLSQLAEISSRLIDIHSQHNNILLNDSHRQLAIIDAFAGNRKLLEDYRRKFSKYVVLRGKLKGIKEEIERSKENREFIMFRLEQLDKLKPKAGELQAIEKEYDILSDADKIKSDLAEACSDMDGGDNSVLGLLNSVSESLSGIDFSLFDSNDSQDIPSRLDSIKIELRDISESLSSYFERVNSDPGRLEKLTARMNSLYDAIKHFKVKDDTELAALHQTLKKELDSVNGDSKEVKEMEKELKVLAIEIKNMAGELSVLRLNAAEVFSREVVERAHDLGLPNIRFEVKIEKGKLGQDGQDKLEFLCSFNKNHALGPISKIASGGEIARLMLCIKSIIAESLSTPTVIFDEVDAGVSGEIAHKMGVMMQGMASDIQVLAVTHLPQVAAKGSTHLKVWKKDNEERTVSQITELTTKERLTEIAGMMSGTSINEAALENARVLLNGLE